MQYLLIAVCDDVSISVCVILHMSVITQEGWSALMSAASKCKTEAVVELVKAGASVDMQTKVCQYIYVVHDVHKLHVYIHVCVYIHVHVLTTLSLTLYYVLGLIFVCIYMYVIVIR